MTTAIVPHRGGGLTRADSRRLALFTRTAGKDLIGYEIDEAVEWCEIYAANPFTKDIYFFVFDADKPAKRRVVPVLGIGLYRKIAARTGKYRADEKPPRFTYDDALAGPLNPKGIVDCEVTVYVHQHGEWFPVTERLRWDERAPIKEIWAENDNGRRAPTGLFELDPKKDNWHRMPETMMAKCVEAAALRKAFPLEMAGSYSEGELDAPHTLELAATEILERDARADRQNKAGDGLIVDWIDGKPLDIVPANAMHGRVRDFISNNDPMMIAAFADRNRVTLKQFWVMKPDEALDLKRAFEAAQKALTEDA